MATPPIQALETDWHLFFPIVLILRFKMICPLVVLNNVDLIGYCATVWTKIYDLCATGAQLLRMEQLWRQPKNYGPCVSLHSNLLFHCACNSSVLFTDYNFFGWATWPCPCYIGIPKIYAFMVANYILILWACMLCYAPGSLFYGWAANVNFSADIRRKKHLDKLLPSVRSLSAATRKKLQEKWRKSKRRCRARDNDTKARLELTPQSPQAHDQGTRPLRLYLN